MTTLTFTGASAPSHSDLWRGYGPRFRVLSLFRRGFTKASLMPGTPVKVDGYQAKDGTRRANGRDLTFTDGRKLFLGSSGTGAPYELARPGVDTQDRK